MKKQMGLFLDMNDAEKLGEKEISMGQMGTQAISMFSNMASQAKSALSGVAS